MEPEMERRPLRSRNLAIMGWLTRMLLKTRISANAISMAGLVFSLITAGLLLATPHVGAETVAWLLLGAALTVQLRLLCNLLDGMVALGQGCLSPVGQLYNELPDRFSDLLTLASLGYAAGGDPLWGWLASSSALILAYLRALGVVAGAGQTYLGPMAKPHRMFVVTVACLLMLAQPAMQNIPALALQLICLGCVFTFARRLQRIVIQLKQNSKAGVE